MEDFTDKLNRLVTQEADSIRQRNAETEEKLLQAEKEKLDKEYIAEQARTQAIADRAVTLNIAWAAAELLKMEKVHPDYWTRSEPVYAQRGIRKRQHQVGTRQSIVAEGWPLARWSVNEYEKPHTYHTLLLTPNETSLGTNLASFSQHWMTFQKDPTAVLPEDVKPLGKEPLAEDEPMPWPEMWPIPRYDGDVPYIKDDITWYFTKKGHKPNRIFQRANGYRPGEHAAYNEAHTEDHIQRAIGRVVAQHLVITPEKASELLDLRRS